jgi:hypothetical protein
MKAKQKLCDGCGDTRMIWKNHEGNRYCKYCWSRKQTMTKGKLPTTRKQKPIAQRSPKRMSQEREYSKLRQSFLLSSPLCQAKLQNICTTHATDVHHMQGRIGNLLTDETKFLAVCRQCHTWIEEHPAQAKELGFSITRI